MSFFRLAITGGIGSGKSTVRKMFEHLGAHGVSADEIARRVVEPGTPGLAKVRELFGDSVLGAQGKMDRKRVAALVFHDPSARQKLELALHPLILEEEDRVIRALEKADPRGIAAIEIPLLAESPTGIGVVHRYDAVLVVTAPQEVRLRRLTEGGGYSREEALARMRSQTDDSARLAIADYVVSNGESLLNTETQVFKIWQSLRG